MIVLVLYAVPVWALIYLLRRRVVGLVVLGVATALVPLLIHVESAAIGPWAGMLRIIGASYAGLIAVVGVLLWLQRRAARGHECRHCLYDLTGNVTGVCPECGHVTPDVTAGEVRRAKKGKA